MKTFTRNPSRLFLGLILKIIITTIWLLCIASAAWAAPGITQQPANQTVCTGGNASFTIGSVVTTTGTVTIQWEIRNNSTGVFSNVTNGSNYSGATTVTLTISNFTTGFNGNVYRCKVTDATGTTTSNNATLSVNLPPAVESGPRPLYSCDGTENNTRSLTPVPGYTFKWQLSADNGGSWSDITPADGYGGFNTNVLTYPPVNMAMDGFLYRYIATETATGCSSTSIALDTLHVLSLPVWFAARPGPPSNSICPGGNISFADSATGSAEIAYRWQISPNVSGATFTDIVDNAVFSGSQTKKLQITGFNEPQGTSWQIRLTANYPSAALACPSSTGISALNVRTLASVTLQPADVATCANSDTSFRVNGAGSPALTYQWQTDNGTNGVTWSNIGTNNSKLSLTGVTLAMNGFKYKVTVGNSCSPPATSNPVTLTVRRSGTWLGFKDIKWEEPQNWCGGVPDINIDVLVPNWPTLMPNISDATGTAFFKSLEIENAARLTISGGTVNNIIRASNLYNLSGTVAYTANSDQEVFPANHGSLEINGTGNKSLNSNVDVAHNLVLGGSAKLVTRTNIITMKAGSAPFVASAFTGAATSWVVTGNGGTGGGNTGLGGLRIEQIDATDGPVTFPVGSTPAAYNPIQLTNSGSVDNYTIAVKDQVIPGAVYSSSVTRTWLVSEGTPGGSNVALNFRWQQNEEQSMFYRTQAQIIRSSGTQIIEQTAAAPASGTIPYFRAGGAFSNLTQFSVASIQAVLPVELRSFAVQKTEQAAVSITWNTTGAATAKNFEVQRSADGVHFVAIGKVNAENGKTAYSYTDNLPGTGKVYYRLLLNETLFSGIQSVLLNGSSLVQLRPSVTTGATTNVYIQTPAETMVNLRVTDISGQIHSRQSVQLAKGEHSLPLWTGGLKKGVYYVHVKDGLGNASVLTLMKQ